jgi:nicotinamide phosphoribosyltransferase
MKNIILNTDFYKASHFPQYPPGAQYVESYIESRGGEYDYTLFNGLQPFVKKYLMTPITRPMIDEAEEVIMASGLPFNRAGWERILKKWAGYLPVEIKSVKEGSIVPVKNVLVTVRNTDPELPWLTSYIETALLRAVWYPSTVATVSHRIKQIIKAALIKSGGLEELSYKLNDFGARGVSSEESAAIGGCGHLICFSGSDNISAVLHARRYYDHKLEIASIPAAEHSTITSWGKSKEIQAYDNMLVQFAKPGSIVAIVSDSYDLWNAIANIWGGALKEKIIESGATVVIRPDSGNPSQVVIKSLRLLEEAFGASTNIEGYKVINHNVRIIQGDGINEESIKEILAVVMAAGYSARNVTFGMGGALLQHMNRDTQRWAMKASSITLVTKNGEIEERDIFKQPATDPGKASKRGRQMLYRCKSTGEYITAQTGWLPRLGVSYLEALDTVYRNGAIYRYQSFPEIRDLSNS